jgi:hypothetical protein
MIKANQLYVQRSRESRWPISYLMVLGESKKVSWDWDIYMWFPERDSTFDRCHSEHINNNPYELINE